LVWSTIPRPAPDLVPKPHGLTTRFGASSAGEFSWLLHDGRPRLQAARSWFLREAEDLDLHGLRQFYRAWRAFDEYLVLQAQTDYGDRIEKRTVAVKCSKRGNDVYLRRVRRRFGVFHGKDGEFFHAKDRVRRSSVLFVTLTMDPKRISLHDSWVKVSSEFNRWITGLREKYGDISALRTWESHESGYPHVHVMLIFHGHEFDVWSQPRKGDGDLVWRIGEKPEFELFPGFVDVRAARTFSAVVRYIEKRVLQGTDKAMEKDRGDLTMALLWVFRKRSFSASVDLRRAMVDLITVMRNSKGQRTLSMGRLVVHWVLIGVFSAGELGLDGSEWSAVLDHVPERRSRWGSET